MGREAAIEKHHRECENSHNRQVARDRLPEHMRCHDQHDHRCRNGRAPEPLSGLGQKVLLDIALLGCRSRLCLIQRRNFVTGTLDRGTKTCDVGQRRIEPNRDAMIGDVGGDVRDAIKPRQ